MFLCCLRVTDCVYNSNRVEVQVSLTSSSGKLPVMAHHVGSMVKHSVHNCGTQLSFLSVGEFTDGSEAQSQRAQQAVCT